MEGPISFWGYKEQESNLILPEHDDDEIIKFTDVTKKLRNSEALGLSFLLSGCFKNSWLMDFEPQAAKLNDFTWSMANGLWVFRD